MYPLSTMATFASSVFELSKSFPQSGRGEFMTVVAFASMVQTYRWMQRFAYSRQALLALTGVLCVTLILKHPPPSDWKQSLLRIEEPHPIEVLVHEARQEFAQLLRSQSKTVDQARSEYERRYDRAPPAGFDQWVNLALEADSPIIDNFDTIMQTLEPFWGMNSQEFRARSTMIKQRPYAQIVVENHEVTMAHDSLVLGEFNNIIMEWTTKHKDLLGDMTFTVNGLAEPRVIVANDRI